MRNKVYARDETVADLKALRQERETMEAEETRLLRRMTAQESLRQWLILQAAFEPQLKATEALFAEERRAALAELQARLARLAEWQARNGAALPLGQGASAAAD
jgi:hypothetical protein